MFTIRAMSCQLKMMQLLNMNLMNIDIINKCKQLMFIVDK